ncbi:hypothetical protein [Nocardia anaemiae]|uniref:hypothetical protein n=1 Tax=Nocardia anaemiae TaxID=263910 RepID=UPI000A452EC5|nr:hypothetical protein [Nocardia anaemiae]
MLLSSFRRAFAIPATCVLAVTGMYLATGWGSQPGTDSTADNHASPRRSDFAFTSYETTVAADQAGHQWAPATSAAITPGTQTYTHGAAPCTANYVFVDDTGHVYIGQAAHCATAGQVIDTNGCTAGSLPLGTPVSFKPNGSPMFGARTATGQLAYSSWLTMQETREQDRNTCAYNDFALVRLAPEDAVQVNPSLPHWGGPVGINSSGTNAGDHLYSYWNSILRGGIASLSPQVAESKIDDVAAGGWTHAFLAPIPGIPGDSGSAFLDHDGYALGTLSTLTISLPIVNNIGDISRELAYARAHSGISGLRLVLGTEPFTPNR